MLPCLPRRLVLARHRVDFRRQWNGLLAECYKMGFNPYDGDCVVFVKRDKRQLRALTGDARGLTLIARRFDGGCLALTGLFEEDAKAESISSAELTMLLDGATCKVTNRVSEWREKQ
jgi:IS66 Orf2 like protein